MRPFPNALDALPFTLLTPPLDEVEPIRDRAVDGLKPAPSAICLTLPVKRTEEGAKVRSLILGIDRRPPQTFTPLRPNAFAPESRHDREALTRRQRE
jgi:hypothetical protein